MKPVKIGVVGCGKISGIYFKNLTQLFGMVEVKGAYDIIEERMVNAQQTYGFEKLYHSLDEMLADEEIEIRSE